MNTTKSKAQADVVKKTNSETKVTIESKIAELNQAVEWFYSDDFTLDDAVEKYKSTVSLAKQIQTDLDELKNQVEVLADFTKE